MKIEISTESAKSNIMDDVVIKLKNNLSCNNKWREEELPVLRVFQSFCEFT